MIRSSFTRIAGAIVALTAVSLAASADETTQSEIPSVVFVAGTSTGSQGFADIGSPSTDTGNINTATTFTIGNLISTGANNGYFLGLSTQIFGPVAFNPGVGSSISFGNATFGSFLSTSITQQTSAAGERSFLVLGNYTAGTFNPSLFPSPAPASLTIAFTQTPPGTGAISDSATLAIPPVPEPSTLVLACVGIAGGLLFQQSRRRPASGKIGAASPSSSTVAG
ncbi:MAG: PEP-CTERM sorting domain-containing protein [Planctomycetaceae bacterium]